MGCNQTTLQTPTSKSPNINGECTQTAASSQGEIDHTTQPHTDEEIQAILSQLQDREITNSSPLAKRLTEPKRDKKVQKAMRKATVNWDGPATTRCMSNVGPKGERLDDI